MQELVEKSIGHGAAKAKVIATDQIVFDPGYRRHCEVNYCGKYGTNYACPPHVGHPRAVIARAKGYTSALVYFTLHRVDDPRDTQQTQRAAKEHWEIASCIEKEISAKTKTYLRLGVGGCLRCPCCAKETAEPCRGGAVSSISAYCIDAARLAGLCEVNLSPQAGQMLYMGLLLF